jgi:hypothetical protein
LPVPSIKNSASQRKINSRQHVRKADKANPGYAPVPFCGWPNQFKICFRNKVLSDGLEVQVANKQKQKQNL